MTSTKTQYWIFHSKLEKCLASAEECQVTEVFPPEKARGMISHMNEDHVEAMLDYCNMAGFSSDDDTAMPKMLSIGSDGFQLQFDNQMITFKFETECKTPLDARTALVGLAKKARKT